MRTIIAILVSVLVSLLLACLAAVAYVFYLNAFPEALPLVVLYALGIAGSASVLGLIVGLPLHVVLLRQRITGPSAYVTMGGLFSALLVISLAVRQYTTGDRLLMVEFYVVEGVVLVGGPIAALVFWIIDRPDK